MRITFEIDTEKTHEAELRAYRAAAAYLLHLAGDLDEEESPNVQPTAQNTAMAPATATSVASAAGIVPHPPITPPTAIVFKGDPGPFERHADGSPVVIPPPPPVPTGSNSDEGDESDDQPSNVVNFPVPPPPPPANIAAPAIPAPPAVTVAAAGNVASVNSNVGLVDSANMPYDVRIHQKSGNKKKDGTWKLIKGLDPAILAAVTVEIAAARTAGITPPPVLLPYTPSDPNRGANTVPVPPPPPIAAPSGVPAPPATPAVPVPPVAAPGALGAFRALIEKITAATKENKITPQDVSRLCQHEGAPSLMQLNSMQELIPKVAADVDAVLAGFSVDAVIAGLA